MSYAEYCELKRVDPKPLLLFAEKGGYRLYGTDAERAAKILGISRYAKHDHHDTTSVPTLVFTENELGYFRVVLKRHRETVQIVPKEQAW